MTTKTATISYAEFPYTGTVESITVTVTGAKGDTPVVQSVTPGTTLVTFDLAADTYTITAQAIGNAGEAVGSIVSSTFVVDAPAIVTVMIPSAISVA